MRTIPPTIGTPLWTVPMAFGGMIFLFGVLIWVQPELLAYVVAVAFCAVGLSIMGFAWRLRPRKPGRGVPGGSDPASGGAQGPGDSYVDFRVEREE